MPQPESDDEEGDEEDLLLRSAWLLPGSGFGFSGLMKRVLGDVCSLKILNMCPQGPEFSSSSLASC